MILAALLLQAIACPAAPTQPNVLVVVLDDVGTDMIGCYGDPRAACTPQIDLLAAGGLRFTRAYAYPVCSPARAAMLTGRYGFRTGIGLACAATPPERVAGLELSETTIFEHLSSYDSALIGKWHLLDLSDMQGGLATNPGDQGIGVYRGNLDGFASPSHYSWPRTVQGTTTTETTWSTQRHAADLAAVVPTLEEPWVCFFTPQAPHFPYEAPPIPQVTGCPLLALTSNYRLYQSMLQDLDRALGVVVPGILELCPNTYVLVVGDNGTPTAFDSVCPRDGKASVYEGGIAVPLIAFGPGIQGGTTTSELVSVVDFPATICELAGVGAPQSAVDSASFEPVLFGGQSARENVYAEFFLPNGLPFAPTEHARCVVESRWKLIRKSDASGESSELYDLLNDPCEAVDLNDGSLTTEEQAALDRLQAELDALGVG